VNHFKRLYNKACEDYILGDIKTKHRSTVLAAKVGIHNAVDERLIDSRLHNTWE